MKYIDDDKAHNQVLYELGILDDDDDWPLFQKMQREEVDVDLETWLQYCSTHRTNGKIDPYKVSVEKFIKYNQRKDLQDKSN